MSVILSQRIDLVLDYADKPYFRYHFPKRYRNQVKSGDVFVYYQGDGSKLANRYYFGCGVIGEITPDKKGDGSLNGEARFGVEFPRKVPIHLASSEGKYYEYLGHMFVRENPNPVFQNSIRKLSVTAFKRIIFDAGITVHANFNNWIA